jgi:hypothetical protein
VTKTHFVDDDWGPLCGTATKGDFMWAFADHRITCAKCLGMLGQEVTDAD